MGEYERIFCHATSQSETVVHSDTIEGRVGFFSSFCVLNVEVSIRRTYQGVYFRRAREQDPGYRRFLREKHIRLWTEVSRGKLF